MGLGRHLGTELAVLGSVGRRRKGKVRGRRLWKYVKGKVSKLLKGEWKKSGIKLIEKKYWEGLNVINKKVLGIKIINLHLLLKNKKVEQRKIPTLILILETYNFPAKEKNKIKDSTKMKMRIQAHKNKVNKLQIMK